MKLLHGTDIKTLFYKINLFLCLSVILLSLIYIYFYGVSIPCYDELAIMPYFEKLFSGSLRCSDLFLQHNEHRIFFPRIVMLLLGIMSKYNCFVEMVFTEVLFCIILVVFYIKTGKQFTFNINTIPVSFLIIPLLLFSWRNLDNILWGTGLWTVMPVSLGVLSIYLIDELCNNNELSNRKRNLYFIYAIMCSTVASFSFISGLLLWIVGSLQLIVNRKPNRLYIVLWMTIGTFEWIFYFIDYKKPVHHPDLLYFLREPVDFLIYFFTCVGGALFWDERTALIAGIIIMAIFFLCLFFLYRDKRLKSNSFWIYIAISSLFITGSISVGRSGFGQSQALSSRYTHVSILIVLAVYIIATDLFILKKQPLRKFILGFLVFIILVSVPFSYKYGADRGKEFKIQSQKWCYILLNYKSQSDEALKQLDSNPEQVRRSAEILEKLKWNIFGNQ